MINSLLNLLSISGAFKQFKIFLPSLQAFSKIFYDRLVHSRRREQQHQLVRGSNHYKLKTTVLGVRKPNM